VLFVGDDWPEDHHDVEVQDEAGRKLAGRRLPEGVAGVGLLHADRRASARRGGPGGGGGRDRDRPGDVGRSARRGRLYSVFAINPLSASRYRDRHVTSRAKSDPGDAHVLADLVRTDRHQHLPVAGDSELAGSVKVLARAHQNLIWSRQQQVNALRSTLREFYPAALEAFPDLAHRDALAVLAAAPTPTAGRALRAGKVARLLRAAGRQRNIETRAEQIVAGLRAEQLAMGPLIEAAMGASAAALIGVISAMVTQARALEQQLAASFEQHPSAEILRSLPGLGTVLGARVLAEFGDDPLRYADAKARRNYAGTSPITRASGRSWVALARVARNRRLADATYRWAFASISASPGARAYYVTRRARGASHSTALRAVANRLVGFLHGCLRNGSCYDEPTAWANLTTAPAPAEEGSQPRAA
jgi:hypothetical protein